MKAVQIEMSLARVFAEVYDFREAWYPEHEVLGSAMCRDADLEDVDRARRNLGIETTEIHGLTHWRWSSDRDPEIEFERKSEELE